MKSKNLKTKWITAGLLMALILSSLDQTVVSTAMPTIAGKLGNQSLYGWIFSIYMLSSTTVMPIYGKLCDLYGKKKVFLAGLFIFLMGSVLCALAKNMVSLVIFRGIQGLGAGSLMPVSFTIVADIYPRKQRGKFQSLFGSVFALSSIAGPIIGGVIVQFWYWGWIFYINLFLGVPALLIIALYFTDYGQAKAQAIDWLGIITFIIAIVSILAAVVIPDTSRLSWNSPIIDGLMTLGCFSLAIFLRVETKATEPLMPLRLFRNRTVTFGNIAGFFISAAMFDITTYVPVFVQDVIGYRSSTVSLILVPLMLAVVLSMNIGGRLMSRISYRSILAPCMVFMGIGFVLLTATGSKANMAQLIFDMAITGIGMGAIYPTLGTAVQSAVSKREIGVATSSSQFFRSIGGAVGVSVFGGLAAGKTASSSITESTEHLQTTAYSLHLVFTLGLGCLMIALIASILLGRDRLLNKVS